MCFCEVAFMLMAQSLLNTFHLQEVVALLTFIIVG